MPLVWLIRKPATVSNELLDLVAGYLPVVVADSLSCAEGGTLKPSEVIVKCLDFGPYDRNIADLDLYVIGHGYEERLKTRDERQEQITETLHQYLASKGVGLQLVRVWLKLPLSSYGEILDGQLFTKPQKPTTNSREVAGSS